MARRGVAHEGAVPRGRRKDPGEGFPHGRKEGVNPSPTSGVGVLREAGTGIPRAASPRDRREGVDPSPTSVRSNVGAGFTPARRSQGTGASARATPARRLTSRAPLRAFLLLFLTLGAGAGEVTLWHSYTGAERAVLEETIARAAGDSLTVRTLFVPFDVLPEKLRTTIPYGQGPDLFIFAHDRLGEWRTAGLLQPLEAPPTPALDPKLAGAFEADGARFGLPLTFKGLFLWVNTALCPAVPTTLEELRGLRATLPAGVFPLAYDSSSFFFHAPFFFACGGALFDGDRIAVFDPAGQESFALVKELQDGGIIPRESNTAEVGTLFNTGKAALVLSGPWFGSTISGELTTWDVAPLFSIGGRPAGSFLSVEGLFLSAQAPDPAAARSLAWALLDPELVALRSARAHQPSPLRDRPPARGIGAVQAGALATGQVTPSRPEMGVVWEVSNGFLRELLGQDRALEPAVAAARQRIHILSQPPPDEADAGPWLLVASVLLLGVVFYALSRLRDRKLRERLLAGRTAYTFSAPAVLAMVLLVFAPFLLGSLVAFFAHTDGEFRFVGLANFTSILFSGDYALDDPLNFYFTLGVTVLWTVTNVFLHVVLGVALALLLRPAWLRLRSVYRVALILPWAIPSYITALTWKSMFNRQYGAINGLLELLGLDAISWFARFSTAFAANLATNTWLGFPFMMVVTLGALQAVPSEQEDVARLAGASFLQRLRWVIWPHIRPVLAPAVLLGSVWTFNMFNVIYLVSGGEPSASTEILISEAYKWAFRRQHRYGYAAAYALLIFVVLYGYSAVQERLGKRGQA